MAKIAERYYIVRNVRAALCARLYMMCVKNAVRIAVSIAADLALLAVTLLHKSSELLPMRRGVVGWHLFLEYITAELNAVEPFSQTRNASQTRR
jgi:hypothetical protein